MRLFMCVTYIFYISKIESCLKVPMQNFPLWYSSLELGTYAAFPPAWSASKVSRPLLSLDRHRIALYSSFRTPYSSAIEHNLSLDRTSDRDKTVESGGEHFATK